MGALEDFEAVLGRIDTATNDVAADLRKLRDDLANAGLSVEQEAAVLGKLDAAATALEAVAADPADPVPTPEPQPEPEA